MPYIIVMVFALGVAVAVGSRALGLWGGKPSTAGDPNAITISYATEAGDGAGWGTVNSPLVVSVKVPWSTGSQDTVLSDVSVQLLDEAGQPAALGVETNTDAFAMKPTFDISTWEWRGSVPSKPGKYHARVQITALYNKERNATVELTDPTIEARPETGPPLISGFVFSQNSNLWLLATDTSRQRRLTFFNEFYEYADKPAWSPDGKRIAFTYSPKTDPSQLPATDIWQVNPDGTDPRPLVTHQESESLLDPSWSADGKYLYFTVDTSASMIYTDTTGTLGGSVMGASVQVDRLEIATGVRQHWMPASQMAVNDVANGDTVYLQYVPVQNGGEGMVAPPERLMKANANAQSPSVLADETQFQLMYAPRMSPDGKWVVFAAINVPPVPVQPVAPTAVPTQGGGFDLFGWLGLAPNGAQAHGLPWDVYMVPASGGQAIRLTKLDEDQPVTAWLDSSTIAFMGTQGLFKISIDDKGNPVGSPVKIHEGAPHGGLSWRGP
jgi:hypothetical protein